ncbi:hypothetical protein [uncultured Clostridium sp.]|uniref:hypothetical protein n=1 Tax=uncultured Clostridium sp. TaxID=59620 RepID=UPI0025E7A0C0|nr:hypothetical protein [uncultured Clostridium sp.]
MKKFLMAACSVILLFFLLHTAYYQWGFYIDLHSGQNAAAFTTTEGKEILVDTGHGLQPFEIKGVDMGAGYPGAFATEYAVDKETYLRWFRMIQDMGANTVRVYTILSDDFYNAVYEYNTGNPNPLYIIHGVWVDDYVQNSRLDAYDRSFFNQLKEDSRTLVDIIHGRKKVNLGYGTTSATGIYTKDISPWVLGYILGVEWEDVTVAYTDHMQSERNQYQGTYLYTSEDATPFEAMLAEAGDNLIRYETDKYKQQRLLAFSNWPSTDPMDYPEEVNKIFQKCAKVDVEHIRSTDDFLSGQFASYHIYPYYPEYLNYYESWKYDLKPAGKYRMEDGTYNTYKIYLSMINNHHQMPVVISEFGVPSSRGMAQVDYHGGRSQGFMTEQEQGEALVASYQDIKEAGCAGSVIFAWQDEWFKRTWNTMANVDLMKTAYWSDAQTNEQFFGLLAFDPGKEKSVCYTDGSVDEWMENDLVQKQENFKLYMKYDEKYIYFRIHKDGLNFGEEKIYLPLDITPQSGSYYMEEEKLKFDRPVDFLIILDGKENSRVLVQERYNAFKVVYSEDYRMANPYFDPPDKDSPVFEQIFMALQMGDIEDMLTGRRENLKMETGKLTYGNGNPKAQDYNSVSDFIVEGNEIELRIPWQLLNFSNPSEMQIHDDYFECNGIENLGIKEIYAGVGSGDNKENRIRLDRKSLKGWEDSPTFHERLKRSYYMVQEAWTTGRDSAGKEE